MAIDSTAYNPVLDKFLIVSLKSDIFWQIILSISQPFLVKLSFVITSNAKKKRVITCDNVII